jgi:Malectin domain
MCSLTLRYIHLCSHTAVGKRVFDVNVEGLLIEDVDLVQLGGGVALKALTRTVPSVSVTDGALSIVFTDNVPLVRLFGAVLGSVHCAIHILTGFWWTD